MASTMVSGSPLTFSSITIPPMARSFTGWYFPTQHNISPTHSIPVIIQQIIAGKKEEIPFSEVILKITVKSYSKK
jgi:hypothetical protein